MIYCLVLGYSGVGLCIFGGKKGFLHKERLGLCIFGGKSDFCTKRGWDCILKEKRISAQRGAGIVHFRREKVISAQREAGIVHFRGKVEICKIRGRDCAFLERK